MNPSKSSSDYEFTEPISLKLLASVYYGDPFHSAKEWSLENEIGHLWSRFMKSLTKYWEALQPSFNSPKYSYEVHYETEEYATTKNYYVYTGVEINQINVIPLDFVLKPLPFTRYAIIKAKTTEHARVEEFLNTWIAHPPDGYIQSYPYIIQRYHRDTYKGLTDPESEMEWLIPVKSL